MVTADDPPERRSSQARVDWALSAGLAVLAGVLWWQFLQQRAGALAGGVPDLRIYLAAARILVGGRPELLYDWTEQQRQQADWAGPPSPFVNPPFLAVLFIPLLHCPRMAAYAITAGAEAGLTVAAMACAARAARYPRWIVLALAGLAQPISLLVWMSVQPAPFVTLSWAGFALEWTRGRREAAVLWVLLGLAVKPHLMLPVLVLVLASGRRGPIALLVGGGLLLGLTAWTLVGTAGLREYPSMLGMEAASGHWSVHARNMPNFRGMLVRLLGDHLTSRAAAAAILLVGLAGIGWAARKPQETGTARARLCLAALACTIAASYHLHVQELAGLFILLALAVPSGWLHRPRVPFACLYLVAALWTLFVASDWMPWLWDLVPLALAVMYPRALRDSMGGGGSMGSTGSVGGMGR